MRKWPTRAVAAATVAVAFIVIARPRTWGVRDAAVIPDASGALDEMRRRLVAARHLASIGEPSPYVVGTLLTVARFGLTQVDVLRGWGKPWLDAQDDATRYEVDDTERAFVEYELQAVAAGARILPVDVPPDPNPTGDASSN